MYNIVRRARLVVLLSVVLLLAGCIQPISEVQQTKTATVLTYGPSTPVPPTTQPLVPGTNPTQPPVMNPTAVSVPAAAPQGTAQVVQFLQQRNIFANGLTLWYDQQQRADFLKGFSYTDAANNPCAGFVIAALIGGTWQATESGAVACATQPNVNAIAASFFFLTSDVQSHTIVFGRVQNPSVTLVSILFDDGSSQLVTVTSGGFLAVKEGVAGPTLVNGLDAQQNVIIPNIQLSPAA